MTSGGVITAPVSISDVRSTLGLSSTALMDIVSKAKVGGRNGRAFTTVEGGGTINEGYLIDGAEPFWNKWSNESPGEWVAPASVDGPLRLRIKRDAGGGRYAAMLGTFRGYNHNSSAPIVGGGEYHFTQGAGSGMLERTFSFKPRLGSYDWRKVAGATMYRAAISGGNIGTVYGTPVSITSEAQTINITITINTNYVDTYTYDLKVYIGHGTTNDFNSIGYIPTVETMKIIIDPKPVITGAVAVKQDGVWRYTAFSMREGVTSQGQTRFAGTFRNNSGITTDGKKLVRMTYRWGTAAQGNEGSVDVTSFNYREGPNYLRSYPPSDNTEAFTSDPSRAPGFYDNHSVTFWYQ